MGAVGLELERAACAPTEALTVADFHRHSLKAVQEDIVQMARVLYHLGQLQEQCAAYGTPLPFTEDDLRRHADELIAWGCAVVATRDELGGV